MTPRWSKYALIGLFLLSLSSLALLAKSFTEGNPYTTILIEDGFIEPEISEETLAVIRFMPTLLLTLAIIFFVTGLVIFQKEKRERGHNRTEK